MTQLFQNKYRIESARLKGWDYGLNGYYFFTICTNNRTHFFGRIQNNIMCLNAAGTIAYRCWLEISNHFPFVVLDEFVIMPNHVHGIVRIDKKNCDHFSWTGHSVGDVYDGVVRGVNAVETQNLASLQMMVPPMAFHKRTHNVFGPQSKNITSIIRGFKTGVTKYTNEKNIDFQW